jgi:lysozyme
MRLAIFASLALAATALTACTSGSASDVLELRPSAEVVSSINVSQNDQEDTLEPLSLEEQNPYPAPIAAQQQAQVQKPVEMAALRPENPARQIAPQATHKRSKIYSESFRDAHPIKFHPARHPSKFEVHGVDVSHWQSKIDWKTLRTQGANFAFIKATEGGKHVDRLFKHNWDEAKKAGIPRGAYHFMYWCRNAEEQANWFIRHVPKEKGALPPVLDVEWHGNRKTCPGKISKKRVLAKMEVWSRMIERHYGQKPIIYTAPDFYDDNLKGQFKDHSFWLRSVAEHPKMRYPNQDFAFWQYSGTGLSKGVATKIDLNVFNGTQESWHRWLQGRVAK